MFHLFKLSGSWKFSSVSPGYIISIVAYWLQCLHYYCCWWIEFWCNQFVREMGCLSLTIVGYLQTFITLQYVAYNWRCVGPMPDLTDLELFIRHVLLSSICYPNFVLYSFIISTNILCYLFYLYLCYVRSCYLPYLRLLFFIPIWFSFAIRFSLFFSTFICYQDFVSFLEKMEVEEIFLPKFIVLMFLV